MDNQTRLTAYIFKLFLMLLCIFFSGCTYFRTTSEQPNTSVFNPEKIRKEMTPLNLNRPYYPTKEIMAYFNFYQLNFPEVEHYFGTITPQNHTLATHVFIPKNPKGTLFLIHGYFDHTGTFSKLISEGLSNHYAIVSWDLPGHGMSTGERTDPGAFDLCAKQFMEIIQHSEKVLPRPFYLIAHSTGCSIAMEYMYNTPSNSFDQIIFLSPLIRHAHWKIGKFSYFMGKPFKKTIRRWDKKNSSNPAYLAFVKQDPLHSNFLSLEYLNDLYNWEKHVQDNPIWPGNILIIQGDQDTVVDWKYNLTFLQKKIQSTEIHIIPTARHQLANERSELLDKTFNIIFQSLEN